MTDRVDFATIDGHLIMLWRNYGSVCPALWTTNGNIAMTARLIAGRVERGSVIVGPDIDWRDDHAIRVALMQAYHDAWPQPHLAEWLSAQEQRLTRA